MLVAREGPSNISFFLPPEHSQTARKLLFYDFPLQQYTKFGRICSSPLRAHFPSALGLRLFLRHRGIRCSPQFAGYHPERGQESFDAELDVESGVVI